MRIHFYFRFLALFCAVAVILTSCKTISEDSADLPDSIASVSEITSSGEILSETLGNTYTSAEITTSSEAKTEADTETGKPKTEESLSDTQSEEKTDISEEITDTKSETTASAAVKTEKIPETATQKTETTTEKGTETTALTLQFESPPETTAIRTANNTYAANSYNALNFSEQKGFWITYLEYGAILKNKSESSFKKSIGKCFDNIAGLGFNTVYVQVRAFGDAYYDSDLYPSGEQFNGTIGTENRFDALQVMIDCAHERGMSLHAWVNPMRLMTAAQIKNIDGRYTIKKWYDNSSLNGKYIVETGGRLYLNPAYGDVTDLIADGISEIVSNYRVDGVQIDDYFYPTTAAGFDSDAYAASGTELSLGKWRMANVNKMVKKLYRAVHSANDTVVFGISPQGCVENNYNELYADVRTWCAESGYCDYILPQVYFGFENAALPYGDVISLWSGMVKASDVQLVIGLAGYKIGAADSYAGKSGKNEWLDNSDIISRQMTLAKTLGNYGGVALYRYDSIFNPTSDVAKQVGKEVDNIRK